jgi:hypothetical protein
LRMEPWETVVREGEARERGTYFLGAGGHSLLEGMYITVMAKSDDGVWRYVWSTVTPTGASPQGPDSSPADAPAP